MATAFLHTESETLKYVLHKTKSELPLGGMFMIMCKQQQDLSSTTLNNSYFEEGTYKVFDSSENLVDYVGLKVVDNKLMEYKIPTYLLLKVLPELIS